MLRTFMTHRVRKVTELSGCLWRMKQGGRNDAGEEVPMMVPGCWEMMPGFEKYRGKMTFSRTVEVEKKSDLRIRFGGVSHTADVYWDGEFIAHHYNAFTAFDALVWGAEAGKHTLTVEVDNSFNEQSTLHFPNDYMTYGGIIRPVEMEYLPGAYIERVEVETVKTGDVWTACAKVIIGNPDGAKTGAKLTAEIAGEKVRTEIRNGTEVMIEVPGALEWSAENPNLYLMTFEIEEDGKVIDDLIERIGFREVRVDGNRILMNGKPLKIRGVCRHEDHPMFGAAIPVEAMARDLELIRDLGCNSVRTSHYPNDERFLDLCDECGILVWEENHARGVHEEEMKNPLFEEQCEDCIREMIAQHRNHPSIYIWGIMNECASNTETGRKCYEKQYALLKELDSSRPRTSATFRQGSDICLDLPDVVSFNTYPEWYKDISAKDCLEGLTEWIAMTGGAGKPLIISEIGAGAIYGYRSSGEEKWTEDYQAEAVGRQLDAVLERDDICGVYIWQFCDVRVCGEWFSSRPRTMNNKGIVDEYRRRKMVYNVVKGKFIGRK